MATCVLTGEHHYSYQEETQKEISPFWGGRDDTLGYPWNSGTALSNIIINITEEEMQSNDVLIASSLRWQLLAVT
jgi:hypothetical protein